MDKQMYLKRFSRAARWRLGHREAAEVVADYTELLEQRSPEQDNTLVEDLGKPEAAARLLTEEKSYRRWLWSFWAMMACLLLPELLLIGSYLIGQPRPIDGAFALGLALTLVWFHPGGEKTKRPRALLWILVAMAVLLAAAAAVLVCLFTGAWENLPLERYGPTAFYTLSLASTVAVAAGIFGMIRARTDDRRWAALYVLGLTTALLSLQIITALMSLYAADFQCLLQQEGLRWAVVGGIGLVGTGVVLC